LYLPSYKDTWPIDTTSATPPANWQGWPEGKKFALVLTHDVETKKGLENCRALMDIDEKHGFRSSFNFVATGRHDFTLLLTHAHWDHIMGFPFFKPDNEDDLSKCILTLIENEQLRNRLKENALQFIEDFKWSTKKDEYFNLVDSL
jgi:metal-dependent hydrolase (beta-lactamase superfamily II)